MKVQPIAPNHSSTNFKARLFQDNKEIKCFTLEDAIKDSNRMEARGNKDTIIEVLDFISKDEGYSGYSNFVECKVYNPLFKEGAKIVYPLYHNTNAPIKGDTMAELRHLDLMTGLRSHDCKYIENEALQQSLINTIKELIEKKPLADLNPIKLFEARCKAIGEEKLSFSAERLQELKGVANELLNCLVKKGVAQL